MQTKQRNHKNYHFRNITVVTDSVKNHQWMLKQVGKMVIRKNTVYTVPYESVTTDKLRASPREINIKGFQFGSNQEQLSGGARS